MNMKMDEIQQAQVELNKQIQSYQTQYSNMMRAFNDMLVAYQNKLRELQVAPMKKEDGK